MLNLWLLLLRLGIAALMLTHGLPKLNMLLNGQAAAFGDPVGLGPATSLVLSAFAEVVCSVLILMGLATRLATIPLIINMLVAVLVVHGGDPFVRQELGLLYLFTYFTLLVTGAGKYSLDQLISRTSRRRVGRL